MQKMLSYLSYILIFSSMFCSTFLHFFPGVVTYKVWALIMSIISLLVIFISFFNKKTNKGKVLITAFFGILLVIFYSLTQFFYSTPPDIYFSFMLVLAGQILPLILCASIVSSHENVQYQIKQLAPFVSVIFTFISFYAAFFPSSATSGGFVEELR